MIRQITNELHEFRWYRFIGEVTQLSIIIFFETYSYSGLSFSPVLLVSSDSECLRFRSPRHCWHLSFSTRFHRSVIPVKSSSDIAAPVLNPYYTGIVHSSSFSAIDRGDLKNLYFKVPQMTTPGIAFQTGLVGRHKLKPHWEFRKIDLTRISHDRTNADILWIC